MTTFVLVPGLGCGAWLWHAVARELTTHGHRAITITLPGLGYSDEHTKPTIEDATTAIIDAVRSTDDKSAHLVAHSGSGVPATCAAAALDAGTIDHLTYYGAVIPEPETSMAEELEIPAPPTIPDRLPVDFAGVATALLPDSDESIQRLVYGLMTSTPANYLFGIPRFSSESARNAPMRYLLGADDHPFHAPAQRFAARIGVTPITVPGAHLGMLTHPSAIAAALLVD